MEYTVHNLMLDNYINFRYGIPPEKQLNSWDKEEKDNCYHSRIIRDDWDKNLMKNLFRDIKIKSFNKEVYFLLDEILDSYDSCVEVNIMPNNEEVSNYIKKLRGERRIELISKYVYYLSRSIRQDEKYNEFLEYGEIIDLFYFIEKFERMVGEKNLEEIVTSFAKKIQSHITYKNKLTTFFTKREMSALDKIQEILDELKLWYRDITRDQIRTIISVANRLLYLQNCGIINSYNDDGRLFSLLNITEKLRESYMIWNRVKSGSYIDSYSERANIKNEKFIKFYYNQYPDILEYFRENKEQILKETCFITNSILTAKGINPYYVFLAFDSLGNKTQNEIIDKKRYDIFLSEYRKYIRYIVYYQKSVLSVNEYMNYFKNDVPQIPYASKMVSPLTLELLLRVKNNKSLNPTEIIKKTSARSKCVDNITQLSKNTLRKWLRENKKFYKKFKNKKVSEVVELFEKEDIIKWFDCLKWVNPFFGEQLDNYHDITSGE